MQYVKFLLILNIFLFLSLTCYGDTLYLKNTLVNKVNIETPSSISTKVNAKPILTPIKEEKGFFGRKTVNDHFRFISQNASQKDFKNDYYEYSKKESEYIKQQVTQQKE